MESDGTERLRLSEWARTQGISRITAYRMLKRGILPVPSERSPTGRWYVRVPVRGSGRSAIYARAAPSPIQVEVINSQVAEISEWMALRHRQVFTVVREIAEPLNSPLPRLERLLADRDIMEILVLNPDVLGFGRMSLLIAALAPQQRFITAVRNQASARRGAGGFRQTDLQAAQNSLSKLVDGPRRRRR